MKRECDKELKTGIGLGILLTVIVLTILGDDFLLKAYFRLTGFLLGF
jgi:hypothetical protein